MELYRDCCEYMFSGCTNLNYIKYMGTYAPVAYAMYGWANGVSSSGTFVKNSAASWDTSTTSCGISTYPCNWTVQTASS